MTYQTLISSVISGKHEAELTVEYDPSPKTSPNSKSSLPTRGPGVTLLPAFLIGLGASYRAGALLVGA